MGTATAKFDDLFGPQASWPFILRREIADRYTHHLGSIGDVPKVLRISGGSGSGKTFFANQLSMQFGTANPDRVVIYVDIPAADLEAASWHELLESQLSLPRRLPNEKAIQIPSKVVKKWFARRAKPAGGALKYLYRVARDLIAQIPVAGPFIKAVLPASPPIEALVDNSDKAAFRYVLSLSKSRDVLLVIDNTQFLSESACFAFDRELKNAGKRLRLVLIERTKDGQRIDWHPALPTAEVLSLELGAISGEDVEQIVRRVLPSHPDPVEISASIFRRSGGNLKSVWFQLKLLAERSNPLVEDLGDRSYEGVIQALAPTDQMVLRLVVFLLGGLSVSNVNDLFQAAGFGMQSGTVNEAITDLAMLGLLVVNSSARDRVRVEHEIVANVVSSLTPEDEKIELRVQLVSGLDALLREISSSQKRTVLADRLIGIVDESEVRNSVSIQAHIVRLLADQNKQERFVYLSTLLRDSVCWDVIDILPEYSVRILLDALQKCSMFSVGLIATERLKASRAHSDLAILYEAKFLVQLFRYDEARKVLADARESEEALAVEFNIVLNLCANEEARRMTQETHDGLSRDCDSEFPFVILRNSGHLFDLEQSILLLNSASNGFRKLGKRFGVATSLNNLGVCYASCGDYSSASRQLETAKSILEELESPEIYQPIVNQAGVSFARRQFSKAQRLIEQARTAAPSSLSMDAILFDINVDAIRMAQASEITRSDLERLRDHHRNAMQTRDRRFIETIGWFINSIESVMEKGTSTHFDQRVVSEVLDKNLCGIEIFVPVFLGKVKLQVPYFLSPHWRY